MVSKAELNALTRLAKEQILKDRLSETIEKTNGEMIAHASLGFYEASIHWDRDLFNGTGVGYWDFVAYASNYYKQLGYKVAEDNYKHKLDITWL